MNALLHHAPVLLVAVPLLGAFAVPLVGKLGSGLRRFFVGLIALLTTAIAGYLAASFYAAGASPIVYVLGGRLSLPSGMVAPIRIMFELDGLSVFMMLITALAALAAVLYTSSFWKERSGATLKDSLMLLLIVGIFGMEMTGDLFNFFVFLEITSIAACSLVGFRVWNGRSQEAAFKVMTLYTLSGLFVLLAVGLLYGQYGGLNIAYLATMIGSGAALVDKIALGLLLTGLAMKAGAVPMHMWAPDAYGEAPGAASILLVANSQASLYGLFRVLFTLYGSAYSPQSLAWILIGLAVLTIIVGVTMALVQRDLKRLIAFGAVSQIGYMMLAVGVGFAAMTALQPSDFGFVALQGGLFHMINDAACIGLLFLAAGIVIRRAGTRDLQGMGGIAHDLKWTTAFFMLGAFALAGMPPLNGFASKLMIYESTFRLSPVLAIVAILASILLLAVFLRAFQAAFLGPRTEPTDVMRPVPISMLVSMGLLALVVVAFGLFPGFFVDRIVTPAAQALWSGRDAYIQAVMSGMGG
ncbi:NADH:ubiquinone oxidoreductase [Candidatus Bipolaricaulota bacterium]|nr:NADH:ubiquinone oxidoreductase [Candidatus Bipolaricaulota bacterium]